MVVRTIQLLSRITDNPRETRKNHKERVHVVVKGGEVEKGRKEIFILRAIAQRATPKYHNYVETQNTGGKKESTRIAPPKGYHIGGNKKSGGGKMRKKSRLCPQLSGYHRGGFSGSPRKKTQFEHTEDLCGGVFNFIGGEREKTGSYTS